MPNIQQPEAPELKKMDVKVELERAEISLHNSKQQVLIQEAIVAKLQEMVK